jgi:hypothetical protein
MFDTISADESQVDSKDSVVATFVSNKDWRFFLQKAKSLDDTKTATLLPVLHLKVGVILEVTTNVDMPNGLYNGAWGFLRYIDPPAVSAPGILWVEFADPQIGQHARASHHKLFETRPEIARVCVHILRVARPFQTTSRQESMVLRWQFPIRPATAGTFHHNQGLTLHEEDVNFRGPRRFSKMAGRHYVGYSRFSNSEGHIIFVLDLLHLKRFTLIHACTPK